MTENGWIKIHRSIWDNPWMYRPNVFMVWMYILCHVEFQPKDVVFEGKRVTLQPGQGLFRFTEVAELLGIPTPTLYRIVDLLKNEKQIEKQSSPRNTVITVVNWAKYQVNEKQMRNKRETNEKQMRNLPIIKECKNDKNDKNNINNTNVLLVHPADDEPKKSVDCQPFIDAWNSLPVKSIITIKGKRLDMLRARIKDYSYDDVLNAISMIRHSPFLLGQNKRGWQVTFDWFIKPNNFLKVLEGNYDDRQRTVPTGKNDMQAGFNEAMSILGLGDNNG